MAAFPEQQKLVHPDANISVCSTVQLLRSMSTSSSLVAVCKAQTSNSQIWQATTLLTVYFFRRYVCGWNQVYKDVLEEHILINLMWIYQFM